MPAESFGPKMGAGHGAHDQPALQHLHQQKFAACRSIHRTTKDTANLELLVVLWPSQRLFEPDPPGRGAAAMSSNPDIHNLAAFNSGLDRRGAEHRGLACPAPRPIFSITAYARGQKQPQGSRPPLRIMAVTAGRHWRAAKKGSRCRGLTFESSGSNHQRESEALAQSFDPTSQQLKTLWKSSKYS